MNTKRNAKVIKKEQTFGRSDNDVLSLPHGNCYISGMSTSVMKNKSQKILPGCSLRTYHPDLTKKMEPEGLQNVQILNTALSRYEQNQAPFKGEQSRGKN